MPCKLFAMSLYVTQWRKSKKKSSRVDVFYTDEQKELRRRSMEISKSKNKDLKMLLCQTLNGSIECRAFKIFSYYNPILIN